MKLRQYIIESTIFKANDRVEGRYIDGTMFAGSIESRRFHSYNSNIMIYKVKLDKPYKGRDSIFINWDVRKNKATDDAELKLSKKKISKSITNAQNKRKIDKLKKDLKRIPQVFGNHPKADIARKEIEDELSKLQGK